MRKVQSVVIVGGGTAGWITAGVLAAQLRPLNAQGISVILVESPNVATIGVGEGTWPTIRNTLKSMGISEAEFLRKCDASFKQASKFNDWLRPGHSYYHPFMLPKAYDAVNLAQAWHDDPQGLSFADAVCVQGQLCDENRAPKTSGTPDFEGPANYAYHLDAGKFATFLKDHCVNALGVKHVLADVASVQSDADGYITGVNLSDKTVIAGDLFVDCTGFSALLIGKHYGVPLKYVSDELFVDTALAIQVPYADENSPISSATQSTAQAAGWIWDIGLTSRRGVGHVYSSAFMSEDAARAALGNYIGEGGKALAEQARKIAITSGYRTQPWIKNCVAIGLSMGFVEPLEASSIVMVELAAKMLADLMPGNRVDMRAVEKRFNETALYRWRAIVDFLKLHYILSQRTEPFWAANRDPSSISDALQGQLETWKHRFPWHEDFSHRQEIFSSASYQYILYGMAFETQIAPWRHLSYDHFKAAQARAEVERSRKMIGQIPTNRNYLQTIYYSRMGVA
jgi:tryptophan 7-halogenase